MANNLWRISFDLSTVGTGFIVDVSFQAPHDTTSDDLQALASVRLCDRFGALIDPASLSADEIVDLGEVD